MWLYRPAGRERGPTVPSTSKLDGNIFNDLSGGWSPPQERLVTGCCWFGLRHDGELVQRRFGHLLPIGLVTQRRGRGQVAPHRRPEFIVSLKSIERRLYESVHDQGHENGQGYRQAYESQEADELRSLVPQGCGQGFDALGPKQLHESVLQRCMQHIRAVAIFAEEAQPTEFEAAFDRGVLRRDREDDQRRASERKKTKTETEGFGVRPVEGPFQLDHTDQEKQHRGPRSPACPPYHLCRLALSNEQCQQPTDG